LIRAVALGQGRAEQLRAGHWLISIKVGRLLNEDIMAAKGVRSSRRGPGRPRTPPTVW
jgi:hypothetical protein